MSTLIDTNILVYAAGADGDRSRQQAAIKALGDYRSNGVIAVQVLAEFANVLLRKGRPIDRIRNDISVLAKTWTIVPSDTNTVLLALMAVEEYQMSFWDAMLWAVAKQRRLTTILSEDGPTGSTIGGVSYLSPF
ncbi:MAG: PIN domain-containing protein [Firmicutes bacterium]|nr:PIN domain-containing protein [Bacillota bacterium]